MKLDSTIHEVFLNSRIEAKKGVVVVVVVHTAKLVVCRGKKTEEFSSFFFSLLLLSGLLASQNTPQGLQRQLTIPNFCQHTTIQVYLSQGVQSNVLSDKYLILRKIAKQEGSMYIFVLLQTFRHIPHKDRSKYFFTKKNRESLCGCQRARLGFS